MCTSCSKSGTPLVDYCHQTLSPQKNEKTSNPLKSYKKEPTETHLIAMGLNLIRTSESEFDA